MKATDKKSYSRSGIIALCSIVYFVSYFSRKDFAAAMAGMITDGAISRSCAGLTGTMLFIFYGLGQLISGYLGDKIKPRHLISIGLAVTAVCNLMMPMIPDDWMIAVWGLNGLAQAMLWPPIVKILSIYLDHKTYVTANLVVTSAAHVATVLLYVFVPIALTLMSWQTVFYTASALAVFAMFVFIVAMRMILPGSAEDSICTAVAVNKTTDANNFANDEKILPVLRKTGVFTILVCIIAVGFLRDGIESWLPMLYSEAFGKSASESTLASIILPIFSIVSISLVTVLHKKGVLQNEISGSAILFAMSLLLAVPLVFTVGMSGGVCGIVSLVLTALICAAMHGINFLLISCLPGRFADTGRSATVGGICNSCVYVGAAISTYGIALISEHMGWRVTVISWCAILAVGILFACLSYRKYSRLVNKE